MKTDPPILSYATPPPRTRTPFDKKAWLIIALLAFGPVLFFVLGIVVLFAAHF